MSEDDKSNNEEILKELFPLAESDHASIEEVLPPNPDTRKRKSPRKISCKKNVPKRKVKKSVDEVIELDDDSSIECLGTTPCKPSMTTAATTTKTIKDELSDDDHDQSDNIASLSDGINIKVNKETLLADRVE